MCNLDDITNKNNEDHKKNDYLFHIIRTELLMIGGSGSEKTNSLINLRKEKDSDSFIDNIYLHAKDLNEPKDHQF